ncbi:Gfo/Idh/MocA family protein [Segatella albensis]|jgi:predicted dehydrogenase|uniref:Gfo/Idh/MocA family protein n=1 Tax=Segatella albensis TaxID=77768 RepID=UPI0003FAB432|nr:Gfo/Idh/MocA family oxidoreductase [Segatella albensis]
MKKISWGFIGCGEVTEKKSGPAFNEVPGSHVEAVMSRSEDKARRYAERHHIRKWYTDASRLIEDPDINAIYIATPPSSHATFAIMAMRAGKPCYIEKPLAASYADCIRINRISEETGVPCFVAYYRRYLPYFQKVKEIIKNGTVGDVVNVQVRFSVPPRDLDYSRGDTLPWRLQPDISGGGYFYDLAPHQLDLLQDIFGVITRAHGYPANRAHLYQAEDTISACFYFESGIPGSGSWCFVGHESAKEDRIEVIGTRGTVSFSVFNYDPIRLVTSEGDMNIEVPNPPYVQLPIIKSVIEDMQGIGTCECTSISATPTNWVLDRILWKD